MKKIFLSIFAAGLMLTSCDMDLNKPGTITDTEAVQTAADVLAFRNSLYSSFRALTSGGYVYYTELAMDQFLGCYNMNGIGRDFTNATINPSNADIDEIYAGCYSAMANVNFLLGQGEKLIESGVLSDDEVADVKRYLAETKFMRAYFYFYLFDHFCPSYDASKGDVEGLGLQLVTVYDPTGDTSKYPGRSSQNATLARINDDLADAFDGLSAYEAEYPSTPITLANSPYVSSYAVAALQARVALVTGQYTTAVAKAKYVIGNHNYALATGEDYVNMWTNDESSELIMVPFVDNSESDYVASMLNGWAYTPYWPGRVNYLPTFTTLLPYEEDDIRFDSFFEVKRLDFGDGYNTMAYAFIKFPGNDALISGDNRYVNKPKPFRLSEQYLIIAEAGAMSPETTEDANKAFNEICKARIDSHEDVDYAGQTLIDAVREFRAAELIGEGFRMSDLRRWGLGFERDGSYPANPVVEEIFVPSTVTVKYKPNDYRYVWPIPQHQMEINPQLKGQQNEGY